MGASSTSAHAIVYTDARNTDVVGSWADLSNRGFTVKLNYLLRP